MLHPIRPVLSTPSRLVSAGRFNVGTFAAPFADVNMLDASLGMPLPRHLKAMRLKEWQHFALVDERWYVSLALFNAKTLGLAQVIIYDRDSGSLYEYERRTLPTSIKVPATLFDSRARYHGRRFKLHIHNHLDAGVHRIDFDVPAGKGRPAAHGSFTCHEKDIEPIVVCLPLSRHRAMYSHKCVTPLEGVMLIAGERCDFDNKTSYGLVDIHKGYYPYEMKWHWATAVGRDSDGHLVGFNLTDNQVVDQDSYNECCVWLAGRMHPLPPVRFSFDTTDPMRPWEIRDTQGLVELRFSPEALRRIDLDALVLANHYRAPYGRFDGQLTTGEGEKLEVDGLFGMCEDFYLRS